MTTQHAQTEWNQKYLLILQIFGNLKLKIKFFVIFCFYEKHKIQNNVKT